MSVYVAQSERDGTSDLKHACLVFACLFPQPFGVNQPGPYVMYTTVDSNGDLKNASGKSFLSAAPHRGSSHKAA